MRHPLIATTLVLATAMLLAEIGHAQQPQLPALKPPPMAPIKPYQSIPITPPAPYNDPSFVAFRKQLAEAADHKDRAALAKLVVAQGFFWMQDKDRADKSKPGIANLAAAVDLGAKDGSGWATLAGFADDATAAAVPDRQDVICAPADPNVDLKAFAALVRATRTEPPEWGYPTKDGVEVRSAAKPDAPVVEKLGLTLVRVLSDSADIAPPADANQPAFLHIATPSGKTGFAPLEAISGLGADEICYTKQADGWKIAGYFGGAAQ